jgi:hypothetical protein
VIYVITEVEIIRLLPSSQMELDRFSIVRTIGGELNEQQLELLLVHSDQTLSSYLLSTCNHISLNDCTNDIYWFVSFLLFFSLFFFS